MSLHRKRNIIRAALGLLIAATVAINYKAAGSNGYAQLIDPWPPIMYFLLVEMLVMVPGKRSDRVNVASWLVTGMVAVVAGWISVQHVAEFAALAGWTPAKQYGLAFMLDGGIVALSLRLVVVAGEISPKPKPKVKAKPKAVTEPDSPRAQSPAVLTSVAEPGGATEILNLQAEGKTQAEIAEQLGVSERTVRRRLNGAA